MKILITGGHLTPALEIIHSLSKETEIVYVGRKHALEGDAALSLEYQIINKENISFINLNAGRLQRDFTIHTIPAFFKIILGFIESFSILKKQKPDIILGFGSYVSLPIGVAGFILRIPLVIHEQTFKIGLANKILSFFASKICISWSSSEKFFKKEKVILTGNPALSNIFEVKNKKDIKKDLPSIIILGGSLGSHPINLMVEKVLPDLLKNYYLVHQTGDAKEFDDFNRLSKKQENLNKNLSKHYKLVKFIDPKDIVSMIQVADIVISRCGANTIGTLLILEKPSLLIPLYNSSNNEQLENAKKLCSFGLGRILSNSKENSENLLNNINDMIKNKDNYKINSEGQKEILIHKNGVKKIIEIIYQYAKKDNISEKKN